MLDNLFGVLTALGSGSLDQNPHSSFMGIDTILNQFALSDFAKPGFQSALMAAVVLKADGAKIDLDQLRSFLSRNSILSAYQEQLETELTGWVEKIARTAGKAAAEEAIAALHLEELALSALFMLARILLFVCTGHLHC